MPFSSISIITSKTQETKTAVWSIA